MAQSSFVVKNLADQDITFALQGQDARNANYIQTGTSLALPGIAVVSHDIKPSGSKGMDKHVVAFKTTVADSLGVPQVATASLMISVPRASEVTEIMVQNLVQYLRYYCTDACVAKLMDGITP